MLDTIRLSRAPLGDVVVLARRCRPPQAAIRKLEACGYAPGTSFGAALPTAQPRPQYARFLDANGIKPLVISAVRALHANPYASARRPTISTTCHRLRHHSRAAGVVAFNLGQGSAPIGRAMRVSRVSSTPSFAESGARDLAQHPRRPAPEETPSSSSHSRSSPTSRAAGAGAPQAADPGSRAGRSAAEQAQRDRLLYSRKPGVWRSPGHRSAVRSPPADHTAPAAWSDKETHDG